MSQTNHSAPERTENVSPSTPPTFKLVAIAPESLRWELRRIAVSKKSTLGALVVRVLEEFVAREKGAAA